MSTFFKHTIYERTVVDRDGIIAWNIRSIVINKGGVVFVWNTGKKGLFLNAMFVAFVGGMSGEVLDERIGICDIVWDGEAKSVDIELSRTIYGTDSSAKIHGAKCTRSRIRIDWSSASILTGEEEPKTRRVAGTNGNIML